MPGDTPKACPTCKSDRVDVRCCLNVVNQSADGHVPYGGACVPCVDVWHSAPLAFDAALAALDVEPTHHPDRMVTTYDILGLDAVRAAHRAEVERAVKEEREACAKLCDEIAAEDLADEREADEAGDDQISAMARESVRTATYLAETIRARGVAKRTDGEDKP